MLMINIDYALPFHRTKPMLFFTYNKILNIF